MTHDFRQWVESAGSPIESFLDGIADPNDMASPMALCDFLLDHDVEHVDWLRSYLTWFATACKKCVWTPYNWMSEEAEDIFRSHTVPQLARKAWPGFDKLPPLPADMWDSNEFVHPLTLHYTLQERAANAYRVRHSEFVKAWNDLVALDIAPFVGLHNNAMQHHLHTIQGAVGGDLIDALYDCAFILINVLSVLYGLRLINNVRVQTEGRNLTALTGPIGCIDICNKEKVVWSEWDRG